MALLQRSIPASGNKLLSALSAQELARLWPRLQSVELEARSVMLSPEQPIDFVHFPQTGLISVLVGFADGRSAEVGLVGSEGMVGLSLVLGSAVSSAEVIVQIRGTMLRLDAASFRRVLDDMPAFRRLLLHYALAFHVQVAQTAACNANHVIEQRLARWLLMAHDRSSTDRLPLTQELLALMLCVHRPGVTVAARLLQKSGLIQYDRGHITIIDRAGLEASACECYLSVRRQSERLLHAPRE